MFHLWVIEGNFENELPLQQAGFNVIWTDDAKPYKKIKVRILNGAHTSLVPGALLAGKETVGECMQDAVVSAFLKHCVEKEILPTIGDNEESRRFAASVFDRFRNPYIRHKLRSIALNSISKFSVRVLPTMLEYKEKSGVWPEALTVSLSFLISFYKNYKPDDNADAIAFIRSNDISSILENELLWGTDLSDLSDLVEDYCLRIEKDGALGVMQWIVSK